MQLIMNNLSWENVLNSLKNTYITFHFFFLFAFSILYFWSRHIIREEKILIDTVSKNQAKEDTVRPVH